jgi:hypothetical protein
VKNSDPLMHNVNTSPRDPGNAANRMNKSRMNDKASPFELVHAKPEPFIQFACNVHNWMYAYAYVLDHP